VPRSEVLLGVQKKKEKREGIEERKKAKLTLLRYYLGFRKSCMEVAY
jgi:hypothetical protein